MLLRTYILGLRLNTHDYQSTLCKGKQGFKKQLLLAYAFNECSEGNPNVSMAANKLKHK